VEEQIVETWNINNRVSLDLLDALPVEALSGVSASKGRSVGGVLAHIHNARLAWLKVSGPELMEGLQRIRKEQATDKEALRRALEASGRAMEALFQKGAAVGKIKGLKRGVVPRGIVPFLGYVIAHEAYHHGEIGIILKQSGHPLDETVADGMWKWATR
jgi:uncharacterized damage-inducible protein DinB